MASPSAPGLVVDIDFTGNPSAGYFDQLRYADQCLAYWRLNSGSTFLDAKGLLNGTIVASPSTATGALPNDSDLALTFNGTTQHAYVLDQAPLALAGSLSLEGWVKVASLPGAVRDLVAKRGSWALQIDGSNKLRWQVKNDTTVTSVVSGIAISTGVYYHVCCVHDLAAGAISLYVDGVLDATATHTVGLEVTGQPVRFALTTSGSAPTFQSSQTASGTSTTATVTKPVSLAVGDLMMGHVDVRSNPTVTPPSGWILLTNDGAGSGGTEVVTRTYYKVADSGDVAATNFTWTLSASVAWGAAITRITGQDTLVPIAAGYSATSNSITTITAGSHLPSLDNCLCLAFFSVRDGLTWTESDSSGAGTERYDLAGIAMRSQAQTTATALSVTGTPSVGARPGTAQAIFIAGAAGTFTGCTLDEFSFWNVALTAQQDAGHFESRNGGVGIRTDVSADVKSFTAKAGRNYELNRIESGEGEAVLNDLQRNYDPGNVAGSHYPGVLPLRRIRSRLYDGTTFYPVSQHFVKSWESQWESLTIARTNLRTLDGFRLLALAGVSGQIASGLAGAQITKLLDKAGWPQADRALDVGQFTMDQSVLAAGADGLSEIQTVVDSELGIFFIDGAGVATFHDFAHRWVAARSLTSQATFADNGTFTSYVELIPPIDESLTINQWIVSTSTGAVRSDADAVSQGKYGLRTNTRSTRLLYAVDAQAQATTLLNRTARPSQRFATLSVQPGTNQFAWASVFPLKISDRVTVVRNQVRKDCFVEGIAWSFPTAAPATWMLSLQLSPCSSSTYNEVLTRYHPVSFWKFNTTT